MFEPKQRIDVFEGTARLAFEDDWTPLSLHQTSDSTSAVMWAKIGVGPFHHPFFNTDVQERLKTAQWFIGTSQSLWDYAIRSPGVPLKGIVWHMSRCGSTLARNLLAATERSVAIGEPSLINSIVSNFIDEPTNGEATTTLHSAMNCFVRPDENRLQRAYLKCTSWNVLESKAMHEAMPSIPGIFIHRDPLLVLASIARGAPGWANEDSFLIGKYGIEPSVEKLERAANILAAYLRAALEAESQGFCRLVAYPDIIDRFIDGDLPEYFGYEVHPDTRKRMLESCTHNSKDLTQSFASDTDSKREYAESIPGLSELVERTFGDLYPETISRSSAPQKQPI